MVVQHIYVVETVKSNGRVEYDTRIVAPKNGRKGISTTAFAILVVIVVIVGGAIGTSYPNAAQKASSAITTAMSSASTASATSPSSTTTTSSAAVTSSIASSAISSNTTNAPPAPSAPLFNFALSSGPGTILIAPGDTVIYPYVIVTPQPSAAEGQAAALEYGLGDELVVVNASEPSGISLHFFGSNLTSSTIYVEVKAGFPTNLELQLTAAPSIAPGVYPITIEASSGTLSVNYSFTLRVVKYLVTINNNTFSPGNLNVTVGSTVYWMDVSSDSANGAYEVVFNAINVQSPVLDPCDLGSYGPAACSIFSYTFTTAGTFSYISNIYSEIKGTITVMG